MAREPAKSTPEECHVARIEPEEKERKCLPGDSEGVELFLSFSI
jgi:hypothetical protein